MSPSKRAQLAVFMTVFVDLLGFGILIPILPLYAKAVTEHPSNWMTWVNHNLGPGDPGRLLGGHGLRELLPDAVPGHARSWAGLSDLVGRRPVLWVSLMGSAVGYLILATTGQVRVGAGRPGAGWHHGRQHLRGPGRHGRYVQTRGALQGLRDDRGRLRLGFRAGALPGRGALPFRLRPGAAGHPRHAPALPRGGWILPAGLAPGADLAAGDPAARCPDACPARWRSAAMPSSRP